MTVPVARLAASRYRDKPLPLRFCYVAPSIRPWAPQRSQDGEFVQAGAELLGLSSATADAECVTLLCDALAALGPRAATASRWAPWPSTPRWWTRSACPTDDREKFLEALADRDYPLLESIADNAGGGRSRAQGAVAHARAQRHPRRSQPGAQARDQRRHGGRDPAPRGGARPGRRRRLRRRRHLRLRPLPGPHLLQRSHLRGLRPGRRAAARLGRPLRRAAGAFRVGHPRRRVRHRRSTVCTTRSRRPAPRLRPRRPASRSSAASSTPSRRWSCAAPGGRSAPCREGAAPQARPWLVRERQLVPSRARRSGRLRRQLADVLRALEHA